MPNPSGSVEGDRPSDDIQSTETQYLEKEKNDMKENGRAEETLESHEVIELQAFIERKTWIEEKIQVTSNSVRNTP